MGIFVQSVGAAWAITELTLNAGLVALVQTAVMLPMAFFAIPAGAIADSFDRRTAALFSLVISFGGALALAILSYAGLAGVAVILGATFTIGIGTALFSPVWQAAVREQVTADVLPSAVALNAISFNVARAFGPALGGIVVAVTGIVSTFVFSALLYLPLLAVLALWRPESRPRESAREPFVRSILSGTRHILGMPVARVILARTFLVGFLSVSVLALMPMVALVSLDGDARLLGILLGAFGVGGIAGSLSIQIVRRRLGTEAVVAGGAVVMGLSVLTLAWSRSLLLSAGAAALTGAMWMLAVILMNVKIQLAAPSWITGRALATYHVAVASGLALGSWLWGGIAHQFGLAAALISSGIALILSATLSRVLPLAKHG